MRIDYQHQEWLGGAVNFSVLKQGEQAGGYKIYPQFGWSDVVGSTSFNLSIDDEVLRELFNNKDFHARHAFPRHRPRRHQRSSLQRHLRALATGAAGQLRLQWR